MAEYRLPVDRARTGNKILGHRDARKNRPGRRKAGMIGEQESMAWYDVSDAAWCSHVVHFARRSSMMLGETSPPQRQASKTEVILAMLEYGLSGPDGQEIRGGERPHDES